MKYLKARFRKDEDGAVLVEGLLVMTVLIMMMAAFVEFTMIMHWWNQGVKGAQLGSRMASVSDPVDSGLKSRDPTNSFPDLVCTVTVPAGTRSPGDLTGGACQNGTYDADAMKRIIFGTDDECSTSSIAYHGICDVFPSLATQGGTVEVSYLFGGLGYEERLAGPVPVIRISIQNVELPLLVMRSFMNITGLTIPQFTATSVSEDMSSTFAEDVI